ncbi:MAG: hypothetical protein ACK4JX_03130 [Flavobacterium sp.]
MKKFIYLTFLILIACSEEKPLEDLNSFMVGNWQLINVYTKDNTTGQTEVMNYYFDDNIIFNFNETKNLNVSENNTFLSEGNYSYEIGYDFINYPINSGIKELLISFENNNYQVDKFSYIEGNPVIFLNNVISNEKSVTLRKI